MPKNLRRDCIQFIFLHTIHMPFPLDTRAKPWDFNYMEPVALIRTKHSCLSRRKKPNEQEVSNMVLD